MTALFHDIVDEMGHYLFGLRWLIVRPHVSRWIAANPERVMWVVRRLRQHVREGRL